MNCTLCDRPAPSDHDEMIDEGWIPYFYVGRREVAGPVCPECCQNRLRYGIDGEWEAIPPAAGRHHWN